MENIDSDSLKDIRSTIERIEVSSDISAMEEDMRNSILQQVNRRINTAIRHSLRIKTGAIAAVILLLFGMSNYISYQYGYKWLNTHTIQTIRSQGKRTSVFLPDGTEIILNSETTLLYPSFFDPKNREVVLKGEAFFIVSKDEKHPFIVKAGGVNVRVLGTCFNVKAYDEENNVEITLEKGKVEVGLENRNEYIQINSGQQAYFDKSSMILSTREVSLRNCLSWKEGKFYFNNLTFEDIAKQLERHFNIKIEIVGENLKRMAFSGEFIRGESLEQILKIITADKRFHYRMEDGHVVIYD
jgi:ferric-dicitrate binding protein FerR (iron transport regulator)